MTHYLSPMMHERSCEVPPDAPPCLPPLPWLRLRALEGVAGVGVCVVCRDGGRRRQGGAAKGRVWGRRRAVGCRGRHSVGAAPVLVAATEAQAAPQRASRLR